VDDIDLRDLNRRAERVACSVVFGIAASAVLTWLLPETERKLHSCLGPGPDFARPALIVAGACGFALAAYAVLNALARRRSRAEVVVPCAPIVVPHARLVRSRRVRRHRGTLSRPARVDPNA